MTLRLVLLALVLAISAPALAQARTRDDVMAGAFRCATVPDGHQWLNCYYGAAQPLRAQLALPAATASQLTLAAAPPAGTVSRDEARARDEVMSLAFHCTSVDDDRQWLDCYYGAAQPMRARLNLPPAPQAPPSPVPSPVRVAPQQTADLITDRLADYKFGPTGTFTLTLANGQVWKQDVGDIAFAKLTLRASDYVVTIRRGFLGAHNITIKGVPGLFRAQRIS